MAATGESCILAFTTLWVNSAKDKLVIVFLIFQRILDLTFHANCPLNTICMKCRILFSRNKKKKKKKKKKYFKMSSAEQFTKNAKR